MRSLRPSRQALGTASVLSAMALVVLDAGFVSVALPSIADALGETPARSVMAVGAYQLALLMGLLPMAHAAGRFGCRRLFATGVAVFGCASLLCTLAPTLMWLVAARFLQGLGGAAIMALGIALLRQALGKERLGAAIAWNAMVVAICSAAAPATGALLLSVAGWHWLFLFGLPIAAAALVLARALPAPAGSGRPVDWLSIALYGTAAASVVLAAQLAAAAPLLAAAAASAAFGCGLGLVERNRGKEAPLVPLDLLASPPFRAAVAASALFFTGQSAGLLALTFHLQLALGRSALTAGLTLALWPIAVAAAAPAAGRLAERCASGSLCAAGGVLLAIGLVGAASWPPGGSLVPLALFAMVCGAGFGLFQVPSNRAMFLGAPAERSAAAGGMQGTARLAGQTAGALLVAFVLSAAPIWVAPRLAMGIAAAAALMAAYVSWRREGGGRRRAARAIPRPVS
jgi:DHA2 family multidrug resistance protein-like MFS transporter